MVDLTGKRFGYWLVQKELGNDYVEALCENCGTIKKARKMYLKNGQSRSCGCRRFEDRTEHPIEVGQRFDRLVVVERLGTNGRFKECLVRCDCKNRKVIREDLLRTGMHKSCGCLRSELAGVNATKHGEAGTPIYRTWEGMRRRCREKSRWTSYTRKGITVYPAWDKSYETFREYVLEHLGERPKGHSLDRIDNSKGYVPGNIQWASAIAQARNRDVAKRISSKATVQISEKPAHRAGNTMLTVGGKTQHIAEWAREMGISSAVICTRLGRGWTVEDAIKQTVRPNHRPITINGETRSIGEWAEHIGISVSTIQSRLSCGWNERDAVLAEPKSYKATLTIDGSTKPMGEWAKESGIDIRLIHTRKKRGWSDKEAVFGKK